MLVVILIKDGTVTEVHTDIDDFNAEIVYTPVSAGEFDSNWSTLKNNIFGKSLAILVEGSDVTHVVSGYHVDTSIRILNEDAASCCTSSEIRKELLDIAQFVAYTR